MWRHAPSSGRNTCRTTVMTGKATTAATSTAAAGSENSFPAARIIPLIVGLLPAGPVERLLRLGLVDAVERGIHGICLERAHRLQGGIVQGGARDDRILVVAPGEQRLGFARGEELEECDRFFSVVGIGHQA